MITALCENYISLSECMVCMELRSSALEVCVPCMGLIFIMVLRARSQDSSVCDNAWDACPISHSKNVRIEFGTCILDDWI